METAMDSRRRCPIRFGNGDRHLNFSVDREDESGTDSLLLELNNTADKDYVMVFENFGCRQAQLFVQTPEDEDISLVLRSKTRTSFEVSAALLNPGIETCRRFNFSYVDDTYFDGTYIIRVRPAEEGLPLQWRHNMYFRTYLPANVLMGSAIFLSFTNLAVENLNSEDDDDDDDEDENDDDDDDDDNDSA
jgi:hypothetical protein